jgi:hypothetical protein
MHDDGAPPGLMAMRLLLAYDQASDQHDCDLLDSIMAEFVDCPDCAANVILSLADAGCSLLRQIDRDGWTHDVQNQLIHALDKRERAHG